MLVVYGSSPKHGRVMNNLIPHIITYLFTACYRTLFVKLIVTQLVKKYPAFSMEPEGSLLYSQMPTIGPCPEVDKSSLPH